LLYPKYLGIIKDASKGFQRRRFTAYLKETWMDASLQCVAYDQATQILKPEHSFPQNAMKMLLKQAQQELKKGSFASRKFVEPKMQLIAAPETPKGTRQWKTVTD
jgi:hypothetical protein